MIIINKNNNKSQTISMKNIFIVFFIVNLILLILSFPIKIKLIGHFNFVKMIGLYSLKTFGIKLLNGKIYYDNGNFIFNNSVNLIKNRFKDSYSKELTIDLIKKINIKKIEIFFNGGVADDSFASAIICGSVSSSIKSLYSYLSQNYFGIKLYEDIDAKFGKNELELNFNMILGISLVTMVILLLKTKIKGEAISEG